MDKKCQMKECRFYGGDYPSICPECARNYCPECPARNSCDETLECIYEDHFQYEEINSKPEKRIVERALFDRNSRLNNLYDSCSSDVKNALDVLMRDKEVWDVILDKKFRVAVSTIADNILEKDGMVEEPLFGILGSEDYEYLTELGHRYATIKIASKWYVQYDHYTTLFYVAPVNSNGEVEFHNGNEITDVDYTDG